jgi:hypothetical protein
VDAVRHFSTETIMFLLFHCAGNVMPQDKVDASSAPSLIYQTIN